MTNYAKNTLMKPSALAPIEVEILLCRGSAQKIGTDSGIKLLHHNKIQFLNPKFQKLTAEGFDFAQPDTTIYYKVLYIRCALDALPCVSTENLNLITLIYMYKKQTRQILKTCRVVGMKSTLTI